MNKAPTNSPQTQSKAQHGPFEVLITFLKLGLTSFGGPIAHLGFFHKELVEKQGWVDDHQYSQLLAICQFLPGPASSQLGFALGLIRAGWLGALCAFVGFTLPSALLLVAFASVVTVFDGPLGSAVLAGLKIVAFAVVADAVLGMSKKLCSTPIKKTFAILAAVTLLITEASWMQLAVVLAAAVAGAIFCHEQGRKNTTFEIAHPTRTLALPLMVLFFLLLLFLPVIASTHGGIWLLMEAFYRAGALVFGGGHVVLPLLETSMVGSGWISQEQFLAGYGASQAIPGPMFAFSAYLGMLAPTEHSPFLGAGLALIFMFLPGFLLIAAALPLWQSIQRLEPMQNAIAGVNAAVVGILGAALYNPIFSAGIQDNTDLAIGLAAFAMLAFWRLSALWAVLWCILASVAKVWLT